MSQNELEDGHFFLLDEKSESVARFVSHVGSQLQNAFLARKATDHLTQQQLAALLDVDRSRIHRCLSGYSNLTLESVAELVWALRGNPNFSIDLDRPADRGCNNLPTAEQHSDYPAANRSSSGTTGSNTFVRVGAVTTARTNRLETTN
ncbi:helix-turn-helix transcriptional regulator [Mesorhizobium sp. YIM 152430]|uniref:helix-turn-helix domain-containing protein n=1 Tax=Mesorhizobium sp. YIM 152430 TaxID=3031761 RepID=UPI0023DC44C2|nr:helix-turn-helix transcriptional regulator [Mesorhizobium sp. YIM 152430]MDF1599685.1 helix-turn-helix transcriptional regulator [Mesorhizobium sp. YIM 152430]